jgi:hypothetical protein
MNRQALNQLLEAYRARIKPKTMLRGPESRFKEVAQTVKNFNPHGEQGRITMPFSGGGGFRWAGKDLRSSPGVVYHRSTRKGFTDDTFDVAAVAAHRKPAASVAFHTADTDFAEKHNQNLRHFVRKAKAKGAIMSPVGINKEYPGSFNIGKRKNVHKLMRMHRAQDERFALRKTARGKSRPKKVGRTTFDVQVGAALGYPRDKVQAFLGRSEKRFPSHHKGSVQLRADVVNLPKAKHTKHGKLATPVKKLPEDRQALIDAILEATIDYVMTRVKSGRSVGPAWIRQQEREVNEDRQELIEKLEASLLAKLKNPKIHGKVKKPYTKNVRSKQELIDRIGKETKDRFGHVTTTLPGHRVFLTRFKKPERLPEDRP